MRRARKSERERERKREREEFRNQYSFFFKLGPKESKFGILSLVPFSDKCFYVQDRLSSHLLFEVLDSGLKILQF